MPRRFTIDVGDAQDSILDALAKDEGTTKAQIVRKALALYALIMRELAKGQGKGLKLTFADSEDKIIKEVVLP